MSKEETAENRDARLKLETEAAALGRAVARQLRPGVGFCLVLYDFGNAGNMAYLANGERADVAKLLVELGSKL